MIPGPRRPGAAKTAALLRAAMSATVGDDGALQKLDAKFYSLREDLPVLAMKTLNPIVALVLAVLCWTAAAAGAQTTIRITADSLERVAR